MSRKTTSLSKNTQLINGVKVYMKGLLMYKDKAAVSAYLNGKKLLLFVGQRTAIWVLIAGKSRLQSYSSVINPFHHLYSMALKTETYLLRTGTDRRCRNLIQNT